MTDSEMLTWLNGRVSNIKVFHEEELLTVYDPDSGITIEDSIEFFVENHKIDWEKEINI